MMNQPLQAPSPRRKVSRDGLLGAALELFLERGFAATRVEDIARRAGVSKGSVYLYFKTKDELFQAVIDQGVMARLEQAEQRIADYSGSATALLESMLTKNLLEFWNSPFSGIQQLIVAESQQFPELVARYYQQITLRARRLLERILQLGIDSGEYRPVDVTYVARCILNALDHEIVTQHSLGSAEPSDLDPNRYVRTMLDLIRHGVGSLPDIEYSQSSSTRNERQQS